MSKICEHKVLPFDSPEGPVRGHAVLAYKADWMKSFPRTVVFWTFDSDANCPIEILVDVSHLTKWLKCSKQAHTVQAVILDDGMRIHATSRSVGFSSDSGWSKAPILCRGIFKIVGLMSHETLFEVAGVGAWCYSKRRPEDEALVLNPWERDNAKFKAEMEARSAA